MLAHLKSKKHFHFIAIKPYKFVVSTMCRSLFWFFLSNWSWTLRFPDSLRLCVALSFGLFAIVFICVGLSICRLFLFVSLFLCFVCLFLCLFLFLCFVFFVPLFFFCFFVWWHCLVVPTAGIADWMVYKFNLFNLWQIQVLLKHKTAQKPFSKPATPSLGNF